MRASQKVLRQIQKQNILAFKKKDFFLHTIKLNLKPSATSVSMSTVIYSNIFFHFMKRKVIIIGLLDQNMLQRFNIFNRFPFRFG